jgi:hypothetical protein
MDPQPWRMRMRIPMKESKHSVIKSVADLVTILSIALAFAGVAWLGMWLTDSVDILQLSRVLFIALVTTILYKIGYQDLYSHYDSTWERIVLRSPLMVLDCITAGTKCVCVVLYRRARSAVLFLGQVLPK